MQPECQPSVAACAMPSYRESSRKTDAENVRRRRRRSFRTLSPEQRIVAREATCRRRYAENLYGPSTERKANSPVDASMSVDVRWWEDPTLIVPVNRPT